MPKESELMGSEVKPLSERDIAEWQACVERQQGAAWDVPLYSASHMNRALATIDGLRAQLAAAEEQHPQPQAGGNRTGIVNQ